MVEIGRCQPSQFVLVRNFVRDISQGLTHPVVGCAEELLKTLQRPDFRPCGPVSADPVLQLLNVKTDPVVEPNYDRRRIDLSALGFEPAVNVVVGVTLNRLEIELAGDLHHRLDPQSIDLNGFELAVNLTQRFDEIVRRQMPNERTPLFPLGWPLAEDLAKIIYALPNDAIRAAWLDLIRPRSVLHALQSIRTQNGPDHAQRQRDVDLKPTALQRALVHPVLVDEEHPERLEAQVPQGQLVALVILTEAARPT